MFTWICFVLKQHFQGGGKKLQFLKFLQKSQLYVGYDVEGPKSW